MSRILLIERQDHLVLCGGLGSSAYVRHEIEARLTGNSNSNEHPRAQRIRITISHDPYVYIQNDHSGIAANPYCQRQLAVTKGLVIDRLKRTQTGQPVLASRRSRLSYGILYKIPFDAKNHKIEDMVIDEVDGKEYANGMIKWIIKKVSCPSRVNVL
jgi:hypothetical protein